MMSGNMVKNIPSSIGIPIWDARKLTIIPFKQSGDQCFLKRRHLVIELIILDGIHINFLSFK